MSLRWSLLLLTACATTVPEPARPPASAAAEVYDVVISGGRVMGPDSGPDTIHNVGIHGGVVAIITGAPLQGRARIDAAGLVVAPGFIDLHQHAHSPEALRVKGTPATPQGDLDSRSQ